MRTYLNEHGVKITEGTDNSAAYGSTNKNEQSDRRQSMNEWVLVLTFTGSLAGGNFDYTISQIDFETKEACERAMNGISEGRYCVSRKTGEVIAKQFGHT